MGEGAERDRVGVGEIAEDAVGFGAADLRLTRDLLLRPRSVMAAYDAEGSTAGGRYPKPLRYFLALYGAYLLVLTFTGGSERAFETMTPPQMLPDLAAFARKSPEETLADLDQWFALFMTPVFTLTTAWPLYRLIRRWSPADDRTDFNQTFSFLNLWTLYQLPLGLAAHWAAGTFGLLSFAGYLLAPVVYALLGRGRWWRTAPGAWLKGAVLTLTLAVMLIPVSVIIWAMALLALRYLP